MAKPNEKLREARERTASLTYPDFGLSRQELAELVNAWIWEHHNKKVMTASANWIGKLERGIIRWPGKLYREALRSILSVPTDTELGFVNDRALRAVVKLEDEDVKRRQAIHTVSGLSVSALVQGPLAALLQGRSAPTPIPRRIGATDIEQVRVASQVFNSWSRTYGGGVARDAVMGQLRWSAGLLVESICPDRLRPELFSAVGYLADVAAFMAVDANAHEEAREVYLFALDCAEKAKDWNLRAEVLSSMAKEAIWTGQPDEGLTLAGQGLIRPDQLTAVGRALLHTDQARALAKMRRVGETLAAVGAADDHFSYVTPAEMTPHMPYYSEARHAQLTGQALFDLAIMLGHNPGKATDQLTAAAAGQPHDPRSQVICLAKLASLAMVTGDPLQAAAIGHTAVDAAGTIRSRRAAEELRELARYAAVHQNLDEVAHLRQRIGTLLRRTESL